MYRTFAVALALAAGISVAHAEDNVKIETADQCHGIAKTLDKTLADSISSLPQKQSDEAAASIKSLHEACEANDLSAAAEYATAARQSLASEN